MENLEILVTGATGFIGSNLVKELYNKGYNLTGVGRNLINNLDRFQGKIIEKPFNYLDWDEMGDVDILFHQAAITDTTKSDDKKMIEINCDAAILLFENAILHGCSKIIYASSITVYGNMPSPYVEWNGEKPLNAYGKSKLLLDKRAMEIAAKHPEVKIVGLRYSNVYGPGESHKGKMASMVYKIAQQILKGDNPRVFKLGEQERDEIYIGDVIKANLCALNAKESCVVNCGTGIATSFNEMISIINDVLGTHKEAVYIDNPFPFFQTNVVCNMKNAKEKIGFIPKIGFREGVEDYYRSGKLTKPLWP